LFHRGLRRIHHQRHQGGPLRHHLEIHGGIDQKDLLSAHVGVSIRLNGRPVDRVIVDLAICYFIVNIFLVLGGGCFMVLVDDMDYVTGMSSVIATLMNIGPGFGDVGPAENYAHISDRGQVVSCPNDAGGAAGDVLGTGDFLPVFLETVIPSGFRAPANCRPWPAAGGISQKQPLDILSGQRGADNDHPLVGEDVGVAHGDLPFAVAKDAADDDLAVIGWVQFGQGFAGDLANRVRPPVPPLRHRTRAGGPRTAAPRGG
jgi:hypothetical protein